MKPYEGPEYDEDNKCYLIDEERDLVWVADPAHFVTYQNATLKQTADIEMTVVWTNGIGRMGMDNDAYGRGGGAKDNLSVAQEKTEQEKKQKLAAFNADAFTGTYDGGNFAIKNVQLLKADYAGFFGSVSGATIKNLKMSIKDYGSSDGAGSTATETVALFAGCALNSTFENLETIKGETDATKTFKVRKDAAAFVGYMAGGTLKNCTNNLNVCTDKADRKTGGLVVITQSGHAFTGATDVMIENCVNNGEVKSTGKPSNGLAGILGYCGMSTTIKNCEFNGTISAGATGGLDASIVGHLDADKLTVEGVNKTSCISLRSLAQNSADGLMFATVDSGVATFVKNADVALGCTYKVMAAAAAYAFAGPGSITFDKTLAPSFTPTAPAGYQVTNEGNVYTCSLIPVTGVTLDKATLTMNVGDVSNLVATVAPDTVLDNKVVWSVVEGDAVKVEAGAVTAVKAGTATVKAAANADSTKFATCVVTVTAPAPQEKDPEEPITPPQGKSATDYAAELNANGGEGAAALVKAPDCVTGADVATFKSCFKAVVAGDNVKLVLDEEKAATTIVPNLDAAEASIVENFDGKVSITVIPGLYYGITAKADVTQMTGDPADWVQATTANKDSFTLTVPEVKVADKKSDKAFFQVKCSATDTNAKSEE